MTSTMSSPAQQRGAAMLLMMFIIGLAVTAYVVKSYDAAAMKARQEEKTMKALAQAKEALISWSVSHGFTPGQMPWPDRVGDGNYDGSSDCATTSFSTSLFIGQLPRLPATSPCLDPNTGSTIYSGYSTYPGIGHEFRDGSGNRIWYAVSRNIVRNHQASSNPVINPGMLVNAGQPDPWLRVVDGNGNVLSNRVAVVLIAPGPPIGNQNRVGNADVSQFLESAIDNNQTFIQKITASDFNDKLIYITIDELIGALEKRVVKEVRNLNFTPDMVRCTLSGCVKEFKASLKWSNEGAYVITGTIDADYYHKPSNAQDFNCKWKLQDMMACEAASLDSRENILNITTPMTSYPFVFDKLTGQDAIKILDKDGNKKGTIGPALNSYFIVTSENLMIKPADWPQWYFANKWDEYIYVVSEAFNPGTGEGECLSSCLQLSLRGQEVQNIKQLVFSRASVNLNELAGGGKATNRFVGVNKLDGAVAWKQ